MKASLKLFLIFLIFLTNKAECGRLLPDLDNPITFNSNDADWNGSWMDVRFSLPSHSPGLHKGGYIAVNFTNASDDNSNPAFSGTNFSCSLTNSSGTVIDVSNGNTSAGPIAYCRVNEIKKHLQLTEESTYTLRLSTNLTYTAKTLSQVEVFTGSSNNDSTIRIDSNRVFGSVHLYSSFKGAFTNPLVITSTGNSVQVTAGSSAVGQANSNVLYIKDTFETTLSLQVNSRIPKDYDYIVSFNSAHFTPFTEVESLNLNATTTERLELKLQGNLSVQVVSAGLVRILGITEDLVPGRKFLLKLRGWTATKYTTINQELGFWVYYRNQHTAYSYTANTALLAVKQVNLTDVSVSSTSGLRWVAEDLTYPVTITFKPNVDLKNVHVRISHASSANAFVGFNAASCDLSGNAGVSSEHGKSVLCHSLGKLTDQSNGFHYYIENLPKNAVHSVQVLAHFSICGNETNILSTGTVTSAKFPLKVQIYETASNTAADASRFSNLITEVDTPDSSFTCSTVEENNNVFNKSLASIDESATVGYLVGSEINNLQAYNVDKNLSASTFVWNMTFDGANITGFGGTTANISATDTPVYLVSTETNKVANNSYVSLIAESKAEQTGRNTWPADRLYDTNGATNTQLENHYLEVVFNKKWFKKGKYNANGVKVAFNDICYTSWKVQDNKTFNFSTGIVQENSNPTAEQKTASLANIPQFSVNRQILFESNGLKGNLSSDSKIDDAVIGRYVLKGKNSLVGTDSSYSWPCAGGCNSITQTNFYGFFTTCLVWNTEQPSRSIFDNVEVNFLLNASSTDRPRRFLRLISYVSMTGLFTPITHNTNFNESDNSDFHVVSDLANNDTSICVLKIAASNYSRGSFTANTYVVFMLNIQLFETDYSSYSNQYPIGGNLNGSTSVHSYSTQIPVGQTDVRIVNSLLNNIGNKLKSNEFSDLYTLSSQLWFTNIASRDIVLDTNNAAGNLYIPHYCSLPRSPTDNLGNLAVGIWFDSASRSTVSKVAQKFSNNNVLVGNTLNDNSFLTDAADKILFLRMSYSAYNVTENRITASPANHVKRTASNMGDFTNLAYLSVLLSDKISLSETNGLSNLGTNTTLRSKESTFWFLRNKYNKYLLGFYSTPIQITAVDNTNSVSFFLDGVQKPTLESMVGADGSFNLANNIVFSGADAANTRIANNLNAGVAWVSLTKGSYTWDIKYTNNETTYYNGMSKISIDVSNRTNADLLNKIILPANSPLVLEFNQAFNSGVFCAIDQQYNENDQRYARSCSFDGTNKHTCRSDFAAGQFRMCCFNLSFSSTTTSFGLTNVLASYGSVNTAYYSYDLIDQNAFGTSLSFITQNIPVPVFSSFSFDISNHQASISDALLKVSIGKQLDYDVVYEITGNFSRLSLYGSTPTCSASTSETGNLSSWSSGDNIIESCNLTSFTGETGIIKVTTRNTIYNCNQINGNTLYIRLHPVRVNLINDLKYTVSVKKASSGALLASSTVGTNPTGSIVTSNPLLADENTTTNLCKLTTIFPAIVGASASLTYEINYSNVATEIEKVTNFPNEVAIYLNPTYFASYEGQELQCSTSVSNGTNLDCYVKSNILFINFKSQNVKSTNSKFTVTVHNIQAPRIATDAYSYPCALNHVSSSSVRQSVVVGRGKYEGRVTSTAATKGRLAFDNSASRPIVNSSPRAASSTLDFGLIVDKAGSNTTSTVNIGNKARIVFELPRTYANSKYGTSSSAVQVSADVKQVKRNTEAATYTLRGEETIASGNTQQNGNTFSILLNPTTTGDNATFELSADVVYFNVRLTGVKTPEDEINSVGLLNVYLTNDDYSVLYRTFTNTNNQYGPLKQNVTSIIRHYRGNRVEYDQRSWVIDIKNVSARASYKEVDLISGVFTPLQLQLNHFKGLNVFSGVVTVDFVFSFDYEILIGNQKQEEKKVSLNSADNVKDFEIGIPCSVAPGRYLVKVNAVLGDEEKRAFISEDHIYVNVNHVKQLVTCSLPNISIPKNSRASFLCTTVNKVYGEWNINFTNANAADSYTGAKVETRNFKFNKRAIFSTLFTANKETTTSVTLNLNANSECLNFAQGNTGTLVVSLGDDEIPTIESSDLEDFTFNTKMQVPSLQWQEINLSYNIPQYCDLSCAITCSELDFPSDQQIIEQDTFEESPTFSFFSTYSSARGFVQTSNFTGLKRDSEFKIRCILRSGNNQGEALQFAKTYTLMILGTSDKVSVPIVLPTRNYSNCAYFSLDTELLDDTKQRIVNLCQNTFSANEGVASGCTKCSDIDGEMFANGFELNEFECVADESERRLRNLQNFQKPALRFLQDNKTEETKTEETKTEETKTEETKTEETKTEETKTEETKTEETKTETVPKEEASVVQQYKHFIVCAVQDVVCNSPQLDLTTLRSQFQKFHSMIDTKEKIQNVIYADTVGLETVPTIDFVSSRIVEDLNVPSLKLCDSETPENQRTNGCVALPLATISDAGRVEVEAIFEENLTCHWNTLLKLNTLPTQAQVQNCVNNRCGSFETYKGEKVHFKVPAETRFTEDREFAIYVTCQHLNALDARSETSSVLELKSIIFKRLVKICPKIDLDVTPETSQCTCLSKEGLIIEQGAAGDDCNSYFFRNVMLLAVGFLILFI